MKNHLEDVMKRWVGKKMHGCTVALACFFVCECEQIRQTFLE